MNIALSRNRPKDVDKKDWEKLWDNAGYVLEALYKTLEEMSRSSDYVKEDDFSIPNHYALLAFQAGKKKAYREVMDMLPNSAKE